MDARAVATPYLQLAGVRKVYDHGGQQTVALGHVDLTVDDGEFLAIVGPSGCGKSTLLQIAAGLAPASAGEVRFRGVPVTAPPEGIVYLFQQYGKSLLPWRTVVDNVAFAIEHRPGQTRATARETSRRYLGLVGLAEFADRYPWQLSGGMQQRVTIARALAAEPRVLLMDEPFSSVDALTRLELHQLVLDLKYAPRAGPVAQPAPRGGLSSPAEPDLPKSRHGFTAVLVTHDVDEAVYLADRIAVLSGRPSQVAQVVHTELPRPRDPIATRELPRFVELRHALLERLLGR